MPFLLKPLYLGRDAMAAYIAAIPMAGFKSNPNTGVVWSPKGIVWHNTGAPSLGQWNTYSAAQKAGWGANLNRYYEGMAWHAGPHFCGTPDETSIVLCDPLADGIHDSCHNANYFGVETVGNFAPGADDPLSGEGLASMQASANIIAALCKRFGWSTLAIDFHRNCKHDAHACPGSLVTDAFATGIVAARLAELNGEAPAPAPINLAPAGGPPVEPPVGSVGWLQTRLNAWGASPALIVDGDRGPATVAAVKAFQGAHGLDVDGVVGPLTQAALLGEPPAKAG